MTREEVIEILTKSIKWFKPYTSIAEEWEEAMSMAIEALQADLAKHGEWKYYNYSDITNPYVGWYECTVCKQHEHIKHKFCPNCGAKMERSEESENK